MAIAIVQQRFLASSNGSGTVHDLPFSGSVTPGNKLLLLMFNSEDVTGVTVNGMSGPPSATLDATVARAVNTGRAYRYNSPDSGATGFRVTTATSNFDLQGWILEVSGMADTTPFTDSGTFEDDFGATEVDAPVDVDAAGDAAFAFFRDVPLANITATRSGFTQSGESADNALLQTNLNTGSGSVTAGCTLSSNGFLTAGFVVSYKAAAAASGSANLLAGKLGAPLTGKL